MTMRLPRWLKRWLSLPATKPIGATPSRPLREFVYLDEVSLRSLLSSQTGEVTDTRSEQLSEASQLGFDGTVGFGIPGLNKADLTSRFQTSNSNSLQTSRKATVQSWFGELHAIPGLRLIEPGHVADLPIDASGLIAIKDRSIIAPSQELMRGALVEFNVRLSADPVFHLGTMVSEFSGIVDELPEMFAGNSIVQQLKDFQPVNKALQRMLAGLIPIRCEALDHAVVEIDGVEYVARRDHLKSLDIAQRPLKIVGVTEHLAYWKDLRRVLFSEAEFTILGRVARDGLQDTWTAIKLGDLFRAVAPDWDEKINTASFNPFTQSTGGTTISINELQLGEALRYYRDQFLALSDHVWSNEQNVELAGEISRLQTRAGTVSGQHSAFKVVHNILTAQLGLDISAESDSAMRARAREASGLSLFPAMSSETITIGGTTTASDDGPEPRLLDVEIVAIYW
jgi:hypothetical protein